MSDTSRPAHMQLYSDVVGALPLPGERMTIEAYEWVRDALWADVKAREPKDDGAGDEKGESEKRGTELHRGSDLASSERAWSPRLVAPDTVTFGFGRRANW